MERRYARPVGGQQDGRPGAPYNTIVDWVGGGELVFTPWKCTSIVM